MSTTVGSQVLVSRTYALPDHRDPLAVLGSAGTEGLDADTFVLLHDRSGLVTSGVAARIPVGTGPDRITEAADRAATLLAGIATENPLGVPGTGPIAVGALPFGDDAPGELLVPAVVFGSNSRGQAWVTETGPASPARAGITGPERPYGAGITGPERPYGAGITGPERPYRAGITGPERPYGAGITGPERPYGAGITGPERPYGAGITGPERPYGAGIRGLEVHGVDRHDDWTATVREALGLILAGRVTKVVLARQLEVRSERAFDTRSILARLRQKHRSCWTYAAGGYVGSSPELLVRRRRDWVESTPMAGTVSQGAGSATDERLVTRLASSGKDLAEHSLVVDEVLAALEPVCREVFAHAEPQVVRLSTVAHLATTVAGWLRSPPLSALALAGLLHPTPAVAGIPLEAALAAISRMEDFDRGLYAGPLGWVDGRGDGDWVVALRGAQLDGNRATVTAGAGIVADSDADAEWRETEAKLEAMLGVLGR